MRVTRVGWIPDHPQRVWPVIRYRLVQVRQNLKKRLFGLAACNRFCLSLPLSFSSSSNFLSFSIQKSKVIYQSRIHWSWTKMCVNSKLFENLQESWASCCSGLDVIRHIGGELLQRGSRFQLWFIRRGRSPAIKAEHALSGESGGMLRAKKNYF